MSNSNQLYPKPFKRGNIHYNKIRHLRGAIIIVEGIIGAGKSTLSKGLHSFIDKAGIPCRLYEEDIDPIMLELFLSDMKKYAFAFQLVVLKQRQKIYTDALSFSQLNNGIAIVDRSLYGDIAFATLHHESGNISDYEWKAYNSIVSNTILPEPSNILYLDVSVNTAMERIKARNRGMEASVYTSKYLSDLDMNYKASMEESEIHVQYLDWNSHRILTDDVLLDICDLLNPRD